MWRMFKRVFYGLIGLLVVVSVIVIVNTFRYQPIPSTALVTPMAVSDPGAAAQKLSAAVKMQTVQHTHNEPVFREFLAWLPQAFPSLHRTIPRQLVGELTPLYRWAGSDPSLEPVLLAAHYDVVAAESTTLDRWTHPPFSGLIQDGFVWGRGSLDNKGAIVAMFEAVQLLIDSGFQPRRTVYFSIGHDEETGGESGAAAVTRHLQQAGIFFAWSLDEGSFILDGIVRGISQPIASINIAQKGMLTLTLTAKASGGHSSMPPRDTAVSTLAKAITRLQDNPFPGGLDGVSEDFFDTLGRHFPLVQRALFANRWLFGPVIEYALSAKPTTNAVLRTTMAPTMLSAAPAPNVLPAEASAKVNFRLHPRDTIAGVVDYVTKTIADDRVSVHLPTDYMAEASGISSRESDGYRAIESSIGAAFGPVIYVAGITVGGTDSRHYAKVAENTYRLNPFVIDSSDLSRLHGIDERLSLDNLGRAISFYRALLERQ